MARGDGDDEDCCHRDKKCRGSGGDDMDEYSYGGYGTDDDGDCIGDDDDIYDFDSDDAGSYVAEEEDTTANDSAAAAGKQRYTVLSEDDILQLQETAAADVAEVLSIPTSFAAVLLRHFKWSATRVKDEWFSDDRRVRGAVGLPAEADGAPPVPMALSSRRLVCGVCFVRFNAGKTRSAGCRSHYYCDECWRGYVSAAVGDGPRCLSLRCPDPACSAAVVKDLVDAVAGDEDKGRYARFALRSYVEESGGAIKWCPAAGCTRAVELGGGDATAAMDVFCGCGHGFCWSCGEEAHRPVSCATVRAWLAKNSSNSETANWVLSNTKLCPKCRHAIEKNHGCNHMTCRCGHQFCWLCFDPWNNHTRCSRYNYDTPRREVAGGGGDKSGAKEARQEELRRRQATASLDRYLFHYERWAANRTSMRRAIEDMERLKQSGLEKMAGALDIPVKDLKFLTEAYELIADGRRVMRWVYAYGYFLDPVHDKAKRGLFDHLQDDANSRLERLHSGVELERRKFCGGGAGAGGGEEEGAVAADAMNEAYRAYKKKLVDLTSATRHYFGNLVKALENDMPEFNSVVNK